MSTPLATFFTKIGFDIDTASLSKVNAAISGIEGKFRNLAKTVNDGLSKTKFDNLNNKVNLDTSSAIKSLTLLENKISSISTSLGGLSNSKIMNASTRLANAEARKLAAESNILKQQASLAKVQADTEKIKQRTLQQGQALEAVKVKATAASVKAQETLANINARIKLKETPPATRTPTPHSPDRRGGGGIAGMGINAQTAITAVASGGLVQSLFKMANFEAAQPIQYEFITGSKEKAGKQIEYVNKLTDDLKLNLMETDTAYKQFLGATDSTIGAEKTQEIFTGIQKFGVMMGSTSDQMKRGQKAISQMLSKQKLSAEELTGTKVPDHLRNKMVRTCLMREALRA